MNKKELTLRTINDNDFSIMEKWLNKEHILKYYLDPSEWLDEIKERDGMFNFLIHFIVIYQDKPIGFCQYYKCTEDDSEWDGEGTYSIDYFIGEDDFLGKGFGKAAVSLLVDKIFSLDDSTKIIVEPDEGNTASERTLLSNDFTRNEKNGKYYKMKDNITV